MSPTHNLCARIARTLWLALKQEAKQEGRSASAQLNRILQERYEVKKGVKK